MRTSVAAFFSIAWPWPMKILPLMPKQIAALHAGFARNAADEQRPIHVAKAFVQIGRRRDRFEQRKRAIVQLHHHAFERAERRWDFDQAAGRPAGPGRTSSPKRCEREGSSRSGRRRR